MGAAMTDREDIHKHLFFQQLGQSESNPDFILLLVLRVHICLCIQILFSGRSNCLADGLFPCEPRIEDSSSENAETLREWPPGGTVVGEQ